jgi:hypothetical protein
MPRALITWKGVKTRMNPRTNNVYLSRINFLSEKKQVYESIMILVCACQRLPHYTFEPSDRFS